MATLLLKETGVYMHTLVGVHEQNAGAYYLQTQVTATATAFSSSSSSET
jgi:hypothetical protein